MSSDAFTCLVNNALTRKFNFDLIDYQMKMLGAILQNLLMIVAPSDHRLTIPLTFLNLIMILMVVGHAMYIAQHRMQQCAAATYVATIVLWRHI